MPLIRLAYASDATFVPSTTEQGVEPHVARILLASRRNNPKHGLVGGLYYGDNRFFQYLEGEQEAVHRLYQTISNDPRHQKVTKLLDEPLAQRTFTNWSMKYVPKADDVNRFLGQHALAEFNPHGFDRTLTEQMIALIRQSSQNDRLINYKDSHGTGGLTPSADNSLKTPLVAAALVLATIAVVGGFLIFF